MFEKFSKKETDKRVKDPSKRTLLFGGTASVATLLFGNKLYQDYKQPNVDSDNQKEILSDQDENKFVDTEMEFDAELTPSNSVWFNDQVSSFLPQFEIDMPIVLEREDVIKIIKEKFIASGIDRPNLRSSVEDLFIGIAIAESRLDESAVSSQGAFRWLQLMPTTWDDLAKEGESKDSLEDNIAVAVRLLEQEYRYLTQTCFVELAHIQKEFFNNNATAFEKYFFTPLLVNAYNAGMGTIGNILKWFVKNFPNPESTIEAIGQSEVMTGFDVFYLFTNKGYSEHIDIDVPVTDDTPPSRNYRQEASTYVAKAYAAWIALKEAETKSKNN